MCFTVANKKEIRILQERYNNKKLDKVRLDKRLAANYISGFAYPVMAIIKSEQPDTISFANWGLVPGFIKNEEKARDYASYTLNAKAETIHEKISFKKVIENKRCLIPVTGFFEWRDVNKNKYPYFIHLKDEEVFSLGGVYDEWINEGTGEINTTFSIITTEANPLMAKIHNIKKRMPLIFTRREEEHWIESALDKAKIDVLMKPLDESLMVAHTIKKINTKTIDVFSDELLKEVEYPELDLLDEI